MADFNGDGHGDVVLWDRNGPRLRFLLGNGDGSLLANSYELIVPQAPTSVQSKDVNGDNRTDLVVATGTGLPVQSYLAMP